MIDLTMVHRRLTALVISELLLVPAFGQVVSNVCDRLCGSSPNQSNIKNQLS
jgi:hypothetical protein